ncbi:reticulon-4 receptor-like 2 [Acipenser ruthenus]|uniref:reticulon-4 receptor-like 2 n=1 Tax=Acipenser ruthenus TaxID=7906 RepID=UPI002740FF2D|nr:reticulon-4 receptor-like 2 [Acipenser ruthenus]
MFDCNLKLSLKMIFLSLPHLSLSPSHQVLWLYSNNISSIKPDSFSDMRDLEELDLGDNPSLRTLHPDSFRGLDKLQSLHIYRCQLGTLPGNIFKKLYSLQFLYLQDNLLQHIQDNLFSDLVNLTHLFLHGNQIRVLSENVFRGLVNLDRLLLHENRVRQVNRKAFRDLGHLTTLFLFNNALTDLPASALSDLSSLQFLRLNGNPWSCSCQARPLWEWFCQVRISSSELLCAGPEERKGLDLRFLREIDFAPLPHDALLSESPRHLHLQNQNEMVVPQIGQGKRGEFGQI